MVVEPQRCRGRGVVEGTPLYLCAAPSGRVFAPLWSKNRYTLCPFWSGIGHGFKGTTGVYEHIYHFDSK